MLPIFRQFLISLLAAGTAGCTAMTASSLLDMSGSRSGLACSSNLGAYSLPRRLIKVEVVKSAGDDASKPYGLSVNEGAFVPDPHHVYCLDFLASRVADERIGVKRNEDNALLLERVFTRSIDQTLANAKNLIQAAADLAAFGSAQSLGRDALVKTSSQTTIREYNIDPFVQGDMRKVNAALRPFGYCIYLRGGGDALIPDWSEGLCATGAHGGWQTSKIDPRALEGPSYASIVDERPVNDELRQKGIFYRPLITHILVIMKQEQPGVPGSPWFRSGSMRLSLPNAAPPFLLRIDRSRFVKAETDVKFNSGVMQSVAVDKESELQALSNTAVEVVQIVQKIPVVTLAIFDNTVTNRIALIDANQHLITTLQDYNQARGLPSGNRQFLTPATNATILQGYAPAQRSAAANDPMTACMEDPARRGKVGAAEECRKIVEGNL